MIEEGVEVIEDNYGKKDGISMKQIILRHIKKISDLSCQELTASYWTEKPVKVGDSISMARIYHPDLKEAYCNAIDFLKDIVFPESDEDFKKKLKVLNEEEDKKFKELDDKKDTQEDWIKKKLVLRKKLFAEVMLMFERTNYFEGEEYGE